MNIEQAKSIDLVAFLSKLGIEPTRRRHTELWYLSPLRSESTPSFKLNQNLNAWYDFGDGSSGDIIDFIKRFENLASTSEALARIKSIVGSNVPPTPYHSPAAEANQASTVELQKIGPVKSKALLAYLKRRSIDPQMVRSQLFEAAYKIGDQSYYGLAFPSNSGGYEIRNPRFKGSIGAKDITTIEGDPKRIAVFEGSMDYLTAIMMNGGAKLSETVIVLNSVSLKSKALNLIESLHPEAVLLYHDNDAPGRATLEFFRQQLPNVELVSKANDYSDSKDLNEWYVGQQVNRRC